MTNQGLTLPSLSADQGPSAAPIAARAGRTAETTSQLDSGPVLRARVKTFAGLPYGQLALMGLALITAIWGIWVTRQVHVLGERRIVSVRLSGLVSEFVQGEARSNTPPELITAHTRAYMKALELALSRHSHEGQVVVVAEAVVGTSVEDITPKVRAQIAKLLTFAVGAQAQSQSARGGQGQGLGQFQGQTPAQTLSSTLSSNAAPNQFMQASPAGQTSLPDSQNGAGSGPQGPLPADIIGSPFVGGRP